jgi:hypothetical protein
MPICSNVLEDIVIFVHGYAANENQAIDQFNLVKKSLESVGSSQPVIGFSWDSDLIGSFWIHPWYIAKVIASQNGLPHLMDIFHFMGKEKLME